MTNANDLIKNELGQQLEVVGICDCGRLLVAALDQNGKRIGAQHATYDDEDYHINYWSTEKVLQRQLAN